MLATGYLHVKADPAQADSRLQACVAGETPMTPLVDDTILRRGMTVASGAHVAQHVARFLPPFKRSADVGNGILRGYGEWLK
jgi:hypothetical protein